MPLTIKCSYCNKQIKAEEGCAGSTLKCPDCGALIPVPLDADEVEAENLDDVPAALGKKIPSSVKVKRDAARRCPKCKSPMAEEAVICIECGYNLRTREQLATVHERFDRQWGSSRVLVIRALVLAGIGLFFLGLCVLVGLLAGLGPGLALAAMLFLVIGIPLFVNAGTTMSAALNRNPQGHLQLTTTRRIGFLFRSESVYDLMEYHRVGIDFQGDSGSSFDRALLLILLVCGVVPGLVGWWFLLGARYTLKLTAKGDPPLPVYWSRSEAEVRDIADTISRVGKLKYG